MAREAQSDSVLASPWGWIAISATILSSVGYGTQTLLDHVSVPADIADLVFFGFFEWDGILAVLAGVVAVLTGWQRNDWTVRFGVAAISYAALAQTIQSLWD